MSGAISAVVKWLISNLAQIMILCPQTQYQFWKKISKLLSMGQTGQTGQCRKVAGQFTTHTSEVPRVIWQFIFYYEYHIYLFSLEWRLVIPVSIYSHKRFYSYFNHCTSPFRKKHNLLFVVIVNPNWHTGKWIYRSREFLVTAIWIYTLPWSIHWKKFIKAVKSTRYNMSFSRSNMAFECKSSRIDSNWKLYFGLLHKAKLTKHITQNIFFYFAIRIQPMS